MKRASIGVSAHLGWASTATVRVDRGVLRVLATDRIETARPGDREALEPYHVAGGFEGLERVPPPSNPGAALQRGLRKQRKHTARALADLAGRFAGEGQRIAFAGILISRGRPAPSLDRAIGSHTQIHIEEGIAVRESIRSALVEAGARVREIDRKTVVAIASRELGTTESSLLAELDEARPENGSAWRKEEKTAALAAWLAWDR